MAQPPSKVGVYVRARGLNKKEREQQEFEALTLFPEVNSIRAGVEQQMGGGIGTGPSKRVLQQNFTYDGVFDERSCQEDLYDRVIKPMTATFLGGINVTAMAYGQTGSGKTYTIMGYSKDGLRPALDAEERDSWGIIPRVAEEVLARVAERNAELAASGDGGCLRLEASYVEIYNEAIRDLLDVTGTGPTSAQGYRIVQDEFKNCIVQGVRSVEVASFEHVAQLLSDGAARRVTGSTHMNQTSSRSHAIFSLKLQHFASGGPPAAPIGDPGDSAPSDPSADKENSAPDAKKAKRAPGGSSGYGQQQGASSGSSSDGAVTFTSFFRLVDLAGSERQGDTGAVGQRLKEATKINSSLSTLSKVIVALAEKQTHVPYRNSKLTHLLSSSLGGNSATCLIACVSPAQSCFNQTLSTLQYASRAASIINKPVLNIDKQAAAMVGLREEADVFKAELRRLLAEGAQLDPAIVARLTGQQAAPSAQSSGAGASSSSSASSAAGIAASAAAIVNGGGAWAETGSQVAQLKAELDAARAAGEESKRQMASMLALADTLRGQVSAGREEAAAARAAADAMLGRAQVFLRTAREAIFAERPGSDAAAGLVEAVDEAYEEHMGEWPDDAFHSSTSEAAHDGTAPSGSSELGVIAAQRAEIARLSEQLQEAQALAAMSAAAAGTAAGTVPSASARAAAARGACAAEELDDDGPGGDFEGLDEATLQAEETRLAAHEADLMRRIASLSEGGLPHPSSAMAVDEESHIQPFSSACDMSNPQIDLDEVEAGLEEIMMAHPDQAQPPHMQSSASFIAHRHGANMNAFRALQAPSGAQPHQPVQHKPPAAPAAAAARRKPAAAAVATSGSGERTVESYQREIDTLAANKARALADQARLEAALAAKHDELRRLQLEVRDFKKKPLAGVSGEANSRQLQDLRNQLSRVRQDKDKLSSELCTARSKAQQVDALSRECQAAKEARVQLTRQQAERQRFIVKLQADLKKTEAAMQKSIASAARATSDVARVTSQAARDAAQHKAKLESLQAQLAHAEGKQRSAAAVRASSVVAAAAKALNQGVSQPRSGGPRPFGPGLKTAGGGAAAASLSYRAADPADGAQEDWVAEATRSLRPDLSAILNALYTANCLDSSADVGVPAAAPLPEDMVLVAAALGDAAGGGSGATDTHAATLEAYRSGSEAVVRLLDGPPPTKRQGAVFRAKQELCERTVRRRMVATVSRAVFLQANVLLLQRAGARENRCVQALLEQLQEIRQNGGPTAAVEGLLLASRLRLLRLQHACHQMQDGAAREGLSPAKVGHAVKNVRTPFARAVVPEGLRRVWAAIDGKAEPAMTQSGDEMHGPSDGELIGWLVQILADHTAALAEARGAAGCSPAAGAAPGADVGVRGSSSGSGATAGGAGAVPGPFRARMAEDLDDGYPHDYEEEEEGARSDDDDLDGEGARPFDESADEGLEEEDVDMGGVAAAAAGGGAHMQARDSVASSSGGPSSFRGSLPVGRPPAAAAAAGLGDTCRSDANMFPHIDEIASALGTGTQGTPQDDAATSASRRSRVLAGSPAEAAVSSSAPAASLAQAPPRGVAGGAVAVAAAAGGADVDDDGELDGDAAEERNNRVGELPGQQRASFTKPARPAPLAVAKIAFGRSSVLAKPGSAGLAGRVSVPVGVKMPPGAASKFAPPMATSAAAMTLAAQQSGIPAVKKPQKAPAAGPAQDFVGETSVARAAGQAQIFVSPRSAGIKRGRGEEISEA